MEDHLTPDLRTLPMYRNGQIATLRKDIVSLRSLMLIAGVLAGLCALFAHSLLSSNPAHSISAVPGSLTQEDWTKVSQLSGHINDLETMQGRFIQVGPDGNRTEGYFVLHRPGRLLFRYLPPSKLEIVSDGRGLVVRDSSVGTHDMYPISQTPLRFLLADSIDLVGEGNVLNVAQGDDQTIVTMQDETPIGRGQIAITMTNEPVTIQQWTVTDPQGQETTVALFEVEYGRPTDPNWFYIDHLHSTR